ncbi:MAG: lamin tail domain-containing protein [Porphyromonadaceae bacterium]|nr:lamin tail domain-containing protein [Porphyromonadaceae bacterium]
MSGKKIGLLLMACCFSVAGWSQTAAALRINEVMTNNVNSYSDPFGNRGAWIEIYNSSAGTVQMAGCYLTDDPANPKKYMIPKGDLKTKIGARQVVLIWADGMGYRGTFHANFTLNPETENYIALYDASGKILVDEVTVPILDPDQSFGSPRNGVRERTVLENPTPEASNYVDSSNPKVEKFAEKDPHGVSMAITAMMVVFCALVLLFLIFKLIGKASIRISAHRSMKAGATSTLAEAKQGAGIPGDVLAAISMAIYEFQEAEHDYEDAILTVKQVKRSYSPWSSKIYGMRKIPQRK